MAATTDLRPIIRRKKKVIAGGAHHGGAWKVAYADFVTAMMAFFLLMWLLNATSEKQRKGLADYFNPTLPISRTSAGGVGMLAGEDMFAEQSFAGIQRERAVPELALRRGDLTSEAGSDVSMALPDIPVADEPIHGRAEENPHPEAISDPVVGSDEMISVAASEAGAIAAERAEQARLEQVSRQVAEIMSNAEDGALERHFFLRITDAGLVIEIIDADDQPLFASASAVPAPILPILIDILVPVLGEITNDIAVVGHTDAEPFGSKDYSNWELSSDRANAARRLLTRLGLPEGRIIEVTGKAAVEPLVVDPTAPQNRRIAITLLRLAGRRSGPGASVNPHR
jgi:chemotaxis protein MotB